MNSLKNTGVRLTDHAALDADPVRRELASAIRELFATAVMSKSGHGNASVRLRDAPDHIVLTSHGLLRGFTEDQTAVVSLDGEVIEGDLRPENVEIIQMHTEVYRIRPDIGSVIHTHSPNVTSYAVAGAPLPARYESLLRAGQQDDVPVAPWGPRGSVRAISSIASTFRSYPGTRAVLLANHGLLATGGDAAGAARLIVAMEETAQVALGAQLLGGTMEIPDPAEATR